MVGLGLVGSACLVEFGFGCVWFDCKIFWLCLELVLVGCGLVWSGCLVEFGSC